MTFKYVLFLVLGALVGSSAIFVSYYNSYSEVIKENPSFDDILKFYEYPISEKKYSCEDNAEKKVGVVLSGMLSENLKSKINRISISCLDGFCWVGLSNCNPWESSECGSRILRFKMSSSNKIIGKSFQCLDIP